MISPNLDKTVISFGTLAKPPDDDAYWQTKSVAERLQAMEYLRKLNYGHDRTSARLARVLEIAEFPRR
jgi:hypothetical protein